MKTREWLVLSVPAAGDEASASISEILLELGGQAVHETGGRLETYVAPAGEVESWVESARARLREVDAGAARGLTWRIEPDRDWAYEWRKGLGARRVGERFVVTPSWVTPETRAGDHVIVIDPEMAFGTGEHATTRAALRLLERVVRAGDEVLDVGTGSAILAIGAARLGARQVLAVECDPDAIANARDNVVRNDVAERIQIVHGLVDEAFLAGRAGRFDVIVANVLSGVLMPLLPAFQRSSRPSGRVILGGILTGEADGMRRAVREAGMRVVEEDVEEEWWTVLCR